MNSLRQCAFLVGGLGTRMGALTAETPKPLLDSGDHPFLAWVLRELARFGFEEIVLLSGYKSERVEDFRHQLVSTLPKPLLIKISIELMRAGTGGAVWHARHLLDDHFLLMNGDSWIDTDLGRFLANAQQAQLPGYVLLRAMQDSARYGTVKLRGNRVEAFHEKSSRQGAGLINGGIYALASTSARVSLPELLAGTGSSAPVGRARAIGRRSLRWLFHRHRNSRRLCPRRSGTAATAVAASCLLLC
ncbi:MAG: sugar phosphate nucleotidyltransferase [Formivibrio sp.]|nr:sugar phosphate nucleotidyltransferase [Formivibrio sp.]